MKEEIIKVLKEIEKEQDITILYSCELGSRTWGLEHTFSDYDVHFIFKRNQIKDYLRLDGDKEDTIIKQNVQGKFDFLGWDIKKILSLHYDNNPEIREWLISDVVYIEMDKKYFEGLPEFDPSALKKNYTEIVNCDLKRKHRGQKDRKLKRRLYDIRCILCWMVIDKGLSPKLKIVDLIEQVESKEKLEEKLKDHILRMIKDHKSETDTIKKGNLQFIDKWINSSFNMMVEENKKLTIIKKDKEIYNKRFFEIVTDKI